MKKIHRSAGFLFFYPLLLALGGCRGLPTADVVSEVIDGDTIRLSAGPRVRYIGIDTPEIWIKKGEKWVLEPQPYAEAGALLNKKLVEGRTVRLEFDVEERDKYDRLLAYVYVGDSMVNAELVRRGYALLFTFPPNVKHAELFQELLVQAKAARRGIWKGAIDDVIPASEAGLYVGKIKNVQGKVIGAREEEGMVVLHFEGAPKEKEKEFRLVIFNSILPLFAAKNINPLTDYPGKKISICSLIKDYRGPEIIVNHPSEIVILPPEQPN